MLLLQLDGGCCFCSLTMEALQLDNGSSWSCSAWLLHGLLRSAELVMQWVCSAEVVMQCMASAWACSAEVVMQCMASAWALTLCRVGHAVHGFCMGVLCRVSHAVHGFCVGSYALQSWPCSAWLLRGRALVRCLGSLRGGGKRPAPLSLVQLTR